MMTDRAQNVAGLSAHSTVSFTVALPVYNEEKVLDHLHSLLTQACQSVGESYEILYINDGSRDGTGSTLRRLAERDARVTVVELSRNFGHPAALAAAIDMASGERLILMDADLQDDPTVIPKMIRAQREADAEIVYVIRTDRKEPLIMRILFGAFHRFIERTSSFYVPRDAGSFGLLGPRALQEVRALTERLRYFPGLRAFVGFKQVGLVVERGPRYDLTSRVGLRGLIQLAGLAFFTQTRVPIILFYGLSAVSLLLSFSLMSYAVIAKLIGAAVVAWASTVTSIAFFSGIIILGQALTCEYLARIYEEVRRRPIYIVDQVLRARVISREFDGSPN